MEEISDKREQIKGFLNSKVNPTIEPLIKQILLTRPVDVMQFIHNYTGSKINQKKNGQFSDEEDQNNQQSAQYLKKLEDKKKMKMFSKNGRQGISAQAFGTFNKKAQFKPKVIQKTKDVKNSIRILIQKSILFQVLSKEEINIVIQAMQQKYTQPKECIIKQGDKGDMLYVVSSGQYDCSKVINGKQTYLKKYQPGQLFGQLSLMYNAPRAATITCCNPGCLYALDRLTFINIIQEAAIKKRKQNLSVLSKVEIFSQVDPYEKQLICDVLREQEFVKGQYIVKQGQNGDRFYILAQGRLIAEKMENQKTKKVFQYKQGDYFGEIALIKNTVRQASIKVEEDSRVVSIQRDAFKRLLGPIEDILSRNMQKYKRYLDN